MPQFEADRRAFIITINSFGTALNRDDRNKLYPNIGMLDPESLARLARASDYDEVRQVADTYSVSWQHRAGRGTHTHTRCESSCLCLSIQEYRAIFSSAGTNPGDKTLEDKFYEREVGAVRTTQAHVDSLKPHPLVHSG